MRIIILGANLLTTLLVDKLSKSNHLITVIDSQLTDLNKLSEDYEIKIIHAHPSYPDSLRKANAEEADAIIAITPNDELNMIACQVAHSIFKVPLKIARISSSHYVVRKELFGNNDLPIDVFINPEKIIARSLKCLMMAPGAQKAYDLCNGQLKAIEYNSFSQEHLTLDNQHQIFNPANSNIAIFPSIHNDDYFSLIFPEAAKIKKIIIGGANETTGQLIEAIGDIAHITVIEPSHDKCLIMAKKHPNITIICEEFSNHQILLQENINRSDWFLALSDDDENNLIAAISAKKLGCKKSLSLTYRLHYLTIIEPNQVDILLSPQSLVLQSIYARLFNQNYVRTYDFNQGTLICIRVTDNTKVPNIDPDYIFRHHQLTSFKVDNRVFKGDYLLYFTTIDTYQLEWIKEITISNETSQY